MNIQMIDDEHNYTCWNTVHSLSHSPPRYVERTMLKRSQIGKHWESPESRD